jgi:hypothetical protein
LLWGLPAKTSILTTHRPQSLLRTYPMDSMTMTPRLPGSIRLTTEDSYCATEAMSGTKAKWSKSTIWNTKSTGSALFQGKISTSGSVSFTIPVMVTNLTYLRRKTNSKTGVHLHIGDDLRRSKDSSNRVVQDNKMVSGFNDESKAHLLSKSESDLRVPSRANSYKSVIRCDAPNPASTISDICSSQTKTCGKNSATVVMINTDQVAIIIFESLYAGNVKILTQYLALILGVISTWSDSGPDESPPDNEAPRREESQ